MAELRPKIVKLCKVVGGLTGMVNKIDADAPEYYCLAGILTDDEADVAIAAGLRHERTAEYLAKKTGRTLEETQKIAEHLAWIGIFRITTDPRDGKDRFFMQIFAPGIMEMMVNNKELLDTHPEVGRAFEEYTRLRMANISPMLPNGYGLMRVVPVENAIKDLPGVRDSREEVYEILKRAEDNGLMHDMPNIEEAGESSAICKCVACGQCVENCQMNALKLGQKLCSKVDLTPPDYKADVRPPWTKQDWNVDYRFNREDVLPTGTAPCKTKCPAHIAVQGYIKLASQGKYKDALELIKKENPFPAVCGRICNNRLRGCLHPRQRGRPHRHRRHQEVHRRPGAQGRTVSCRPCSTRPASPTKKIAVIGAGPAGLSCAYYLAEKGYPVTVFEKEKQLGGMLTMGIPEFRLEKNVVNAEIDILREMGVEFKPAWKSARTSPSPQLRKRGLQGLLSGHRRFRKGTPWAARATIWRAYGPEWTSCAR
jgi:succinate dehydrogenase/fumarate reductase-like Fe-S protein